MSRGVWRALAFGACITACNGLLGVDFEGRLRTPSSDAALADGGVAADDSGGVVYNRAWSMWKMYDESPLQLEVLSPFLVVDQESGLTWASKRLPELLTWPDAITACANLDSGGFRDFRLPTRIELFSIMFFRNPGQKWRSEFENVGGSYWTRSQNATDPQRAWALDFNTGTAYSESKTFLLKVQCVRSGRTIANLPADRYARDLETVYDRIANLTWLDSVSGPYDPAGARDYCRTLSVGGMDGFRVPALHELNSLIDDGSANPALARPWFTETLGSEVWASTNDGTTSFAYVIDLRSGVSTHVGSTTRRFNVRCVR
jgi:Protein of unknown function (DUF1566)